MRPNVDLRNTHPLKNTGFIKTYSIISILQKIPFELVIIGKAATLTVTPDY